MLPGSVPHGGFIDPGLVHAFLTSDLVSRSHGRCYFSGRCGSIVKVLGKTVSLQAMEGIMQVHSGCAFLCVRTWIIMVTGSAADWPAGLALFRYRAMLQACLESKALNVLATALRHPRSQESCIVVLIKCDSFGAADHNPGIHVDAVQMSAGDPSSPGIKTWKLSHATESNIRHALARAAGQMPQPAAILLANQLPCLPSGKFDRSAAKKLQVWNEMLSGGAERMNRSLAAKYGVVPTGQQSREAVALQDVKRARVEAFTSPSAAGVISAGGTPAAVPEHAGSTGCGMARMPEVVVMKACAEALHGSAMMTYLEPNASLLEIGANSLHIFAIASLLGCSTEVIYQHPAPRSLARALPLHHSPVVPHFSRQHHGLDHTLDTQPAIASRSVVDAVTLTATDVPISDSPARAMAAQIDLHSEQAGLALEYEDQDRICAPTHRLAWPSQHASFGCILSSASVQVLVSDSRGESATIMIKPADLPCNASRNACFSRERGRHMCQVLQTQDFRSLAAAHQWLLPVSMAI